MGTRAGLDADQIPHAYLDEKVVDGERWKLSILYTHRRSETDRPYTLSFTKNDHTHIESFVIVRDVTTALTPDPEKPTEVPQEVLDWGMETVSAYDTILEGLGQ